MNLSQNQHRKVQPLDSHQDKNQEYLICNICINKQRLVVNGDSSTIRKKDMTQKLVSLEDLSQKTDQNFKYQFGVRNYYLPGGKFGGL